MAKGRNPKPQSDMAQSDIGVPVTAKQWSSIKFLSKQEFLCSCCGKEDMQENFLRRLDAARLIAAVPFAITSGWRCASHNLTVGGVSEGAHTRGQACDIAVPDSARRYAQVSALLDAGFSRIGVYNGTHHIHVDYDMSKPQGVMWTGGE